MIDDRQSCIIRRRRRLGIVLLPLCGDARMATKPSSSQRLPMPHIHSIRLWLGLGVGWMGLCGGVRLAVLGWG